jgi:hypothetical protein
MTGFVGLILRQWAGIGKLRPSSWAPRDIEEVTCHQSPSISIAKSILAGLLPENWPILCEKIFG